MKKSNFIKSTGLLSTALVVMGCFLFFTSASSEEISNSQSINKLSADLVKMSSELEILKAEKAVSNEPYLGEIAMFAGNFAPRGWAFCDGQILPIAQNQSLFSLLGTTYGGDGRTTLALPDLRGRVAIHAGRGPGLANHELGQRFGVERSSIRTTKVSVTSGGGVQVVSDIPDMMNNMQPSLGVNYIIALQGTFPSRS